MLGIPNQSCNLCLLYRPWRGYLGACGTSDVCLVWGRTVPARLSNPGGKAGREIAVKLPALQSQVYLSEAETSASFLIILNLKGERGNPCSSRGFQISWFQPCSFCGVQHTLLRLKSWFLGVPAKPTVFSTLLINGKASLELWNKIQFLRCCKIRVWTLSFWGALGEVSSMSPTLRPELRGMIMFSSRQKVKETFSFHMVLRLGQISPTCPDIQWFPSGSLPEASSMPGPWMRWNEVIFCVPESSSVASPSSGGHLFRLWESQETVATFFFNSGT